MWTRTLRNSMRHREGQSLVLACLMILIVSLAVITTVNVGHTIHERVRLQNTADAAAFSMAAVEARAFNFYAFTNRTQVSHYVSAMSWMSVNSMFYGLEAFITDVFAMLASIIPKCDEGLMIAVCGAAKLIPGLGTVIAILGEVLDGARLIVVGIQLGLVAADLDTALGRELVPMFRSLNRVVGGMAGTMMSAVSSRVGPITQQIIEDNDPNVNAAVSDVLTTGLTRCLFERAHNPEVASDLAGMATAIDPRALGDTNGRALAKRSMGQISNASRFPCDGPDKCLEGLITRRTFSQMLDLPDSFNSLTQMLEEMEEQAINGKTPSVFKAGKLGQTKMLSHTWADGQSSNRIRDNQELPNQGISTFAQGDNLGADDLYWLNIDLGFNSPFNCSEDTSGDDLLECYGDPRKDQQPDRPFGTMFKPSIWALNPHEGPYHEDGGIHYRLVKRTGLNTAPGIESMRPTADSADYASIGLNQMKWGGIIDVFHANIRGVQDGNHPWGGLAPFPHFEPALYTTDCPGGGGGEIPNRSRVAERQTVGEGDYSTANSEFNQPSAWIVLNKQPDEMRNPISDPTGGGSNAPTLLNEDGALKINLAGADLELELDDDRVALAGLNMSVGINAVARAQTYYHRPGNWNEQPNFFNPYWRPRLAPVQQGLYSFPLLRELVSNLPGPFREASHRFVTH
jgi:hypothetical protein